MCLITLDLDLRHQLPTLLTHIPIESNNAQHTESVYGKIKCWLNALRFKAAYMPSGAIYTVQLRASVSKACPGLEELQKRPP